MKKLIFLLFIFCSVFASAQISIPQVTGLPAALNSKVDKVSGKSLVADTLSAKIQPHVTNFSNPHGITKTQVGLGNVDNTSDAIKPISTATQTALNLKEPLLPSTPSSPETKWLNGNKQWAEMVMGSGGYASNVYFTNLTSTIVGSYKQTSGINDVAETIASATCNNNEVLINTYLFEQPVGITTIDAGVWRVTLNSIIDAAAGDSKFKFVQYRRSAAGVETDMFTIYSNTIENRVGYEGYLNNVFETVQPSFTVEATDRLGCRIYATTTAAGSRTLSYKVGDGFASYLNTPLALRHSQLRDPNGDPNNLHLTAAQVATFTATSANNTVDETLASIKTKLGAATAVSDGYLRYQDFALLHTPTTVTASNGLSISGQNISLQAASLTQSGALTFNDWSTFNSKEPAFSKNTGFNLPLGTTTGTVLEGRTFGTAANSAVGDFQPTITGLTTNYLPKWNGSSMVNSLVNEYNNNVGLGVSPSDGSATQNFELQNGSVIASRLSVPQLYISSNAVGIAYAPTRKTDGYAAQMVMQGFDGGFTFNTAATGSAGSSITWVERMRINNVGNVNILSTTTSTSPATGALVVGGGGIGADHVRANNFYGNGSNLTGVQLPITLTTTGTSGAATFSGNVLNVPNYDVSAGVNQTQTTVNGSTSGTVICSMPFQTASYKKVILKGAPFGGDATYTFPTSFTAFGQPHYSITGAITIVSLTSTSITINASTTSAGWVILEGY